MSKTTLVLIALTLSAASVPAQYEMLGSRNMGAYNNGYQSSSSYDRNPNPSYQVNNKGYLDQNPSYTASQPASYTGQSPNLQQAGETINYAVQNISQGVGMFFDTVFGRRSYHPSVYPQVLPQADPNRGEGRFLGANNLTSATQNNYNQSAPAPAQNYNAPATDYQNNYQDPSIQMSQTTPTQQYNTQSPAPEPSYIQPAPSSYTAPAPQKKTAASISPNGNERLYNPLAKTSSKKKAISDKPRSNVVSNTPSPSYDKPVVETPAEESSTTMAPAQNEPSLVSSTLPDESDYPFGSIGSEPGRVKSPYPPYNELDVTGLGTGQLAIDPTTDQIFRVP